MSINKGNPGVSKTQLDKLINNYRKKIKRVRKGSLKLHDHDVKVDTKSAWFSRAAVEELFAVNEADGLRIYFGVHDNDVMETPYDDQLTVILVATKTVDGRTVDQIYDQPEQQQQTLMAAKKGQSGISGGSGLNHAKICPPDNCP
jgi:hypothetical protein